MTPQRGLLMWLFQRVTGVFLVFGITVHIVVTHFTVRHITFAWVNQRLHSGWWVMFDFFLLTFAFYHGFNGLYGIVLDYNPTLKWRKAIGWGLFIIGVGWIIYGVITLGSLAR